MKGHTGDVVVFLSNGMSHPSSPPLDDDGTHAVMAASSENFRSGNGLRPGFSHKILAVKSGRLDDDIYHHSPIL